MRITNTMMNEAARESGLPINRSSLLDYINKDSSGSVNSLIETLNQKNGVFSLKQENYETLLDAAELLNKAVDIFSTKEEENIFSKAETEEGREELYDGVKTMVKEYNNTIKSLWTISSPLNDYYKQMLKNAATENKEKLENVGIVQSKDGTLTVDRDVLKNVDLEKLESVFDSSGSFMEKVSFLSEKIADNAETNMNNLTNQYNASGNIYSKSTSKYDFRG